MFTNYKKCVIIKLRKYFYEIKGGKNMNRKVILAKVLSILLMGFMMVATLYIPVFADDPDPLNPKQFTIKDESGASTSASNIIGAIINIAQVIGVGVAVIMLIVLAIKYISAAPSEKAEIKKTVVIYVTGAIVLFASSGILQIIKNFATNVDKPTA